MRAPPRSISRFRPGLSYSLLAIFFGVLWLGGGASAPDAFGQVVVRSAAWLTLIAVILLGEPPSFRGAKTILVFLAAALSLTLLQLVPLPPQTWQSLPGRGVFIEAAAASGQAQPWRPWSLVPGATINAASALIVPIAVLILAMGLKERERRWLPGLILCLIVASTLVGLMQFSGAAFNNPLINDLAGEVSGAFANRNHFALFTAFGCVLTPVWAFLGGRQLKWRGPTALALVLLFVLTILASGSRAGLLLGLLALGLGLLAVKREIKKALSRYPRWIFSALIAGIAGTVATFVLISVVADRAVSIDRALTIEVGQDLRARALPTILEIIRTYFPVGTGLGSFDPIFRIHEPFDLLSPYYLNHAHNDFLEVAVGAGAPGLLLLLAALLWWARASFHAWRPGVGGYNAMPKLGSSMLLLVLVASVFDYPARTPMIMAIMVVAGVWLSDRIERERPALPTSG